MEHHLKVSTWNLKGALSDPYRVNEVLKEIDESESDIIVLPDAWRQDSERSRPQPRQLEVTAGDFRRLGYTMLKSTFREDRPDDNYAEYGFATLIRQQPRYVPDFDDFDLGTRPGHHVRFDYGTTTLNIIGLYFNDQDEANRNYQLDALRCYMEPFSTEPTILAGDFNAMHRQSLAAQLLNSPLLQPLLKLPVMNNAPSRLRDKAIGSTMAMLTEDDFVDVDPRYSPTTPSRVPLFQLAHILTRNGFSAPLAATRPEFTSNPQLSDHLMVSSIVSLDVSRR